MSRVGLVHGIIAYALWGVVAIYWKLLKHVAPLELIAHRAIWGLLAFLIIAGVAGQLGAVRAALRDGRTLLVMFVSATALAINWSIFVCATIGGHLLDASLGYFINPLVSIALGTIVLRERLSKLQWVAIALAATGVAVLAWRAGEVPWIAFALAGSWGTYGLVRKLAKVDAIVGSTVETVIIVPIALAYVIWHGGGAMVEGDPRTVALLVCAGGVTAIPLVFFTSAARKLPLSTVGFLQYLTPTGQFLLAVLAFGEPLAHDKLIAFAFIWAGLIVFSIDIWRASRRSRDTSRDGSPPPGSRSTRPAAAPDG